MLGNPPWLRIPEAAPQLSSLHSLHANTVFIPPAAIDYSFQTTCKPPELCVRADSLQPQINITLWFVNGKKEMQGINMKRQNSNVLVLCLLLVGDRWGKGSWI